MQIPISCPTLASAADERLRLREAADREAEAVLADAVLPEEVLPEEVRPEDDLAEAVRPEADAEDGLLDALFFPEEDEALPFLFFVPDEAIYTPKAPFLFYRKNPIMTEIAPAQKQ